MNAAPVGADSPYAPVARQHQPRSLEMPFGADEVQLLEVAA